MSRLNLPLRDLEEMRAVMERDGARGSGQVGSGEELCWGSHAWTGMELESMDSRQDGSKERHENLVGGITNG